MAEIYNYCDSLATNANQEVVRFCPVPKVKGIYYPSQDQLYKQFKNENCNIQKNCQVL